MSNKPNNYQKHLNQEQRIVIEKGLDSGKSIKTIAQETGKDPTTISKEIKRHRIFKEHNTFNWCSVKISDTDFVEFPSIKSVSCSSMLPF